MESDDVVQVVAGQTAALALKKVKRNQVRKGMVLVDERAKPKASWEFDADIAILTHSTTIQPRYQVCIWPCTVHCDDIAVLLPESSSGESPRCEEIQSHHVYMQHYAVKS